MSIQNGKNAGLTSQRNALSFEIQNLTSKIFINKEKIVNS